MVLVSVLLARGQGAKAEGPSNSLFACTTLQHHSTPLHSTQRPHGLALQEFEKQEVALQGRLAAKTEERDALADRAAEAEQRAEDRLADADAQLAARDATTAEFAAYASEQPQQLAEQLAEIFHRRVRRPQQRPPNGGGGGGGGGGEGDGGTGFAALSDSSDDDDDDDEGDDSSSFGGFADDDGEACPVGCSQTVYGRTLELRCARQDAEDAAAAASKAADGHMKERELLVKKALLVEQSLAAINQVRVLYGFGGSGLLLLRRVFVLGWQPLLS